MITEFILECLFGLIRGLIALGPSYTPPVADAASQASMVGATASGLNSYAPVGTLALVLALLVAAKLALMVWQLVVFIYHQFWGSS
ncbi:MAG: hypothetical protein LBK95_11875 [Bifidobacteriaceae bacterium]|jgi:hypothetical protein|nr:hypothetical protein [Bifidobacteriaceae bacterium]